MKGKVLLVLAIMLCFSFGAGFASNQKTFNLVSWPRAGSTTDTLNAMTDNQVGAMGDAFGWDLSLGGFRSGIGNAVDVKMNVAMPRTVVERFRYSVLRDGEELAEIPEAVQLGDVVRFSPEVAETQRIGNDWFGQGGSVDSPPIEMLSSEEYEELKKALFEKYEARYPCKNMGCFGLPEDIPVFETEETAFNEMLNSYQAENGYTAYVVPIADGKKAGMQVFCTARIRTSNPSLCEDNGLGGFDCAVSIAGPTGLAVTQVSECMYYVGKVIFNGKAVQADWFASDSPGELRISRETQAITQDQIPPVADFSWELGETNNVPGIVCDGSISSDPDGEIISHGWEPTHYYSSTYSEKKEIHFVPTNQPDADYTIALTVTDDEGITDTVTKTINPSRPQIFFDAVYNPETQKAELSLECPEESAELDIANKISGEAVLEKQSIACGEMTEVGPVTATGAYEAMVSIGEASEAAIFTVPSQ